MKKINGYKNVTFKNKKKKKNQINKKKKKTITIVAGQS